MGDEKEFLTALVESEGRPSSGIPFNVELQQVEPLFVYKGDEIPITDISSSLYESDQDLDSKVSGLTHHEFVKWRKAALSVSVVSVIIQGIVSIISIVEGLKVDSSGTFGFGLEGSLDIATTLIVIWRFFGTAGMIASDGRRELRAVVALSILMAVFAIGIIVKVIFMLTKETKPFRELELMIICNVGFASYSILAWLKLVVGQRIQSKAVIMDAVSTFGASAMALALLFSLLVYHFTGLWFLDSIVAIVISLLLFTYGVRTLFKIHRSRKKTKL